MMERSEITEKKLDSKTEALNRSKGKLTFAQGLIGAVAARSGIDEIFFAETQGIFTYRRVRPKIHRLANSESV